MNFYIWNHNTKKYCNGNHAEALKQVGILSMIVYSDGEIDVSVDHDEYELHTEEQRDKKLIELGQTT